MAKFNKWQNLTNFQQFEVLVKTSCAKIIENKKQLLMFLQFRRLFLRSIPLLLLLGSNLG